MPETATLPRTKFVHVELDFAIWAKLRQRLVSQNRTLRSHVTNLIVADVEQSDGTESDRRPRPK